MFVEYVLYVCGWWLLKNFAIYFIKGLTPVD